MASRFLLYINPIEAMDTELLPYRKTIYSRALSLLFIVVSLLLTSCATIMSRSKYDISINTEPQNATVHVYDKRGNIVASGVTPITVRLKAGMAFSSERAIVYASTKTAMKRYNILLLHLSTQTTSGIFSLGVPLDYSL